ncbi:hypothetical protein ABBQ32_008673 [Trebouxia sp. C0010 RCD-2024]
MTDIGRNILHWCYKLVRNEPLQKELRTAKTEMDAGRRTSPSVGRQKDKWRNLNMEAREEAFEQLQPDDDPDFRREVSSRKRKKPRNSAATPSATQRPLQQHNAPVEVTQNSNVQHAVTAAAETEADSLQPRPQLRPPPTPLNCVSPDLQGSLASSPDGKGGPIVDDMVVAAVISLQDPVGSGLDDICTWIEDHYPAVDTDRVMMVMNNMVHAGRLQRVPHHHPTLVRMGGAIMQEAEAEQAAIWSDDADILAQERDHGNLISVKVVAEHALLAAHAIADAEEAVRKANSLLAAANALEDLDSDTHNSS